MYVGLCVVVHSTTQTIKQLLRLNPERFWVLKSGNGFYGSYYLNGGRLKIKVSTHPCYIYLRTDVVSAHLANDLF
jgi:hypothetical protein